LLEDRVRQAVDLDDQEPATRRCPKGTCAKSSRESIDYRLDTEDKAFDGHARPIA
jgi:hypothetical protein